MVLEYANSALAAGCLAALHYAHDCQPMRHLLLQLLLHTKRMSFILWAQAITDASKSLKAYSHE